MTTWLAVAVSAYFVLLLALGFRGRRKGADESEFLLSSRQMTLPAMVATLVSTWYGGILGVGEFIYSTGIAAWLVFGVPYYVFALLFAWLAAPKIREAEYMTIPDLLFKSYGRKAGILGGFFVAVITTPAPYLLITGTLLAHIFGWPLWPALLVATLFSTIYLFWGGFRSVVLTDKLQFALMFAGFVALLAALVTTYDSPLEMFGRLPDTFRDPAGNLSAQEIIVWFFIASWTFIDPGFHQRCAAARDGKTARRGVMLSVLFWLLFDMLTLWTGLYAVVFLPQSDPLMIYPLLAQEVLPAAGYVLLLLALLAIAMSTVDSFTFLSAQTLGRDMALLLRRSANPAKLNRYTRIGLALTAAIALLLIWLVPSVVDLWFNLGSLFLPALLLPVISGLYPRLRLKGPHTFTVMALAFAISLAGFIYNALAGSFALGMQPFIPGLLFSVGYYTIVLLVSKA